MKSSTEALSSNSSTTASKVCVVCGDKSYGLNFNAITCESCKAFFRRNALSKKELQCPFSNACNVTRVTRRFCQKCRLVKCFAVGMKKEHIMSDEERMRKKEKIESNRAKKSAQKSGPSKVDGDRGDEEPPVKVKREDFAEEEEEIKLIQDIIPTTESEPGTSSLSPIIPSGLPTTTSTTITTSNTSSTEPSFEWPTLESSPSEMVNSIIDSPMGSGRVIAHLMKTPDDAITAMEKIINSPKDALKIIGHFINSPGDSLKIISIIMNSPFDALTIFTKFMSSPTDALEVITKVIQSPNDVLQFLQQLMRHPEDGLDIMNKFMNAPAEALRMINKMMNEANQRVDSTTGEGSPGIGGGGGGEGGLEGNSASGEGITLIEIKPSDSIMNNSAQLKVILDKMGEHLNNGSPAANIPSSSTVDAEFLEVASVTGESAEKQLGNGTKDELPPPTSIDLMIPPDEIHEDDIPQPLASLFSGGGLFGGGGSGSGGGFGTAQDIIDMLINQSVNSMDSAVFSEAIKLEYECALPMSSGMPNVSPSMYMSPPGGSCGGGGSGGAGGGLMADVRPLNDVEYAKLQELIVAHEALYAPVHEDISSLIADDYRLKQSNQQGAADPQLLTLINLTAVAIRRLIKMSKRISAFKNMCQEDQVALLKGGCTEMMMLRSVMQYDSEKSSWKIPHSSEAMSNLKADVLKLARGPVYEEHERFVLTFEKKWRQDENIIILMCAIILFTHDRPKTIHADVIKFEQNSYYYLLRRYLESVYPGCEAKSTFMRLIQKVHELRKFNEAVISVYLDVNPAEVEPLLREIFDLKNQ